MSTALDTNDQPPQLSQQQVIAFLQGNPQFLAEHPELFEVLVPPEQQHGRGVIDFQYYAIDNLRRGMRKMKDRFHGLVTSARENLSVQQQVQQAVLSTIRARTLEELLEVLTADLARWPGFTWPTAPKIITPASVLSLPGRPMRCCWANPCG